MHLVNIIGFTDGLLEDEGSIQQGVDSDFGIKGASCKHFGIGGHRHCFHLKAAVTDDLELEELFPIVLVNFK